MLKKISINGWVMYNGGGGGGGSKQNQSSKLIFVPQTLLIKTSNFSPKVSKILSKCVPELA